MAFESVRESGATWNPCTTGSKKDGTLKDLELTDKSYIIGYFTGSKHDAGKSGEKTIHKIKLGEVGDPAHVNGDFSDGDELTIWGTMVLDDLMSKVNPGAWIKISWTGKKTSKRSGSTYHGWDVAIDRSVEPLSGATTFSSDNVEASKTEAAVTVDSLDSLGEDEDDLPF